MAWLVFFALLAIVIAGIIYVNTQGGDSDDSGSGGGGCFVAGTPITMADGSTKAIETVVPGETVLAYDADRGTLAEAVVEQTFTHTGTKVLIRVNGTLLTTRQQPFFAGGSWIAAEHLSPGAELLVTEVCDGRPSLRTVPAAQLEQLPADTTTFNLEVATHHSYFANGVLVHNKKVRDP